MIANKSDGPQETKPLSARAQKRRAVREVATKLQNLSPTAKMDVVNEVVGDRVKQQVGGFADFIREQGVVGVGIGLVLGIQIKAMVDAAMANFVNPVTQLLLPGKEALSSKSIALSWSGETVKIGWGAMVYSVFTFLMVAFIIYVAYKALKLERIAKKKDK